MRRSLVFAAVAVAALVAAPGDGAAFGRRGRAVWCRHVCPPPPVWYPAPPCPPGPVALYPAVYLPPGSVVYPPTPYCGVTGGVYQPVPWGPGTLAPLPRGTGPVPGGETAPRVVTIQGKRYRIVPHPDRGDYREDVEDKTAAALPFAKAANIPPEDRFSGTSRRVAKTTVFTGEAEDFKTVAALLDSLPSNEEMRDKKISSAPTSKRVEEERKNVRVRGYVYAFKKERDKDYHVIIGDAPGAANPRYMNVEVSGIPIAGTDENRAKLWAVRKAFQAAFGLGAAGPDSYFRPDPPVPVRVTGSLFWDVDHEEPPFVGPQSYKPKTAWEIHPVSGIEFLKE
jgi:hypothetical protein